MAWKRDSYRHGLSAKGVKTAPFKIINVKKRKVTVPEVIYHGTSIENAKIICREGLKAGLSPGVITEEYGFAGETDMFVSMAKNENDAIFFAFANQPMTNLSRPQAIIRIKTARLSPSKLVARPLFDKPNSEILHFGHIPAEAIDSILIRSFVDKEGNSKLTETVITPDECLEM